MLHPVNKEITSGTLAALILTLLLGFFNRSQSDVLFWVMELPLFFILYWMIFSIGTSVVSHGFRYGIKNSLLKTAAFPAVLLFLYYLYLSIHGQPLFQEASLLLPHFIFFPVLAFYHRPRNFEEVTSLDFWVLILFLLPVTLVKLPERSALPMDGFSFDSLYRVMVLLVTVYAFVVVRRLEGVGFRPDFSWKKLWTTLWVWGVFIGLIFALGYGMDFIRGGESRVWDAEHTEKVLRKFLSILLHTALFEELFFRGLFQNLLSRKIQQTAAPLRYWVIGGISLLVMALITGIGMDDGLVWFPLLVTFLLFLAAGALTGLFPAYQHEYLALAMTSCIFGLVHWHAGSVVFVGFAMIGGWAYGYVYRRTQNVFYAALLHALVNISPMLMGLQLMK